MKSNKHTQLSWITGTFKNRSILTKIIIATTIIFILVSMATQFFLYRYIEDIVYDMELEKMENAHATVYDTFTSASLTNQASNNAINEYTTTIAKTYATILSNSNYSKNEMSKAVKEMGAEEIHITDQNGKIIHSTKEDSIGINLNDDPQLSVALKALDGEIVIEDAPTRGDHLVQYINVPRIDKKGIIRIGFSSIPHKTIYEESSPQHSIGQTKIGKTGVVMAINEQGNIRVHSDETLVGTQIQNKDFVKEVIKNESGVIDFIENGIKYHGIYEKRQGLYIIAAMGMAEIQEKTWVVQRLSMLFAIINLLLIVFGVYLLFKNLISKKMKVLVDELEALSSGDLTREIAVKNTDEMGTLFTSFNHTVEKIRNLILEVTISVDTVSSSSEELTASSHQISDVTQEIAQVINEIAISSSNQAEDVNNGLEKAISLEKNTENLSALAKELHSISDKIELLKDQGIKVNENLTEKTIVSNRSVEDVSQMVSETNESAKEINEIVNVIDNIASQTNLLALNASIEAARSGEHGHGFAVVAEEIRKLAVQSADSVQNIQSLIKELQKKSNETLTTMTNVKKLIDEQTNSVEDNKKLFSLLTEEISASKERVNKLTSLETQIIENKSEIVLAFGGLSNSASDNAASTEEVSASTEELTSSIEYIAHSSNDLSALAIHLKDMMDQFKV